MPISSPTTDAYPVLSPDLQISFWTQLPIIRSNYLSASLSEVVGRMDIPQIDSELATYVGTERLQALAAYGLRGETFYPVPCILQAKPLLLGYYRLLYGISQKEFYSKGPFGKFKSMETGNRLSRENEARLPMLCQSLGQTGWLLFNGVQPVNQEMIDDLQLFLVGAQLRGIENNKIGRKATRTVFELVRGLVAHHLDPASSDRVLLVKNAAGRTVRIAFAADPDIAIVELLPTGVVPSVSIEIKGGADASNIHNRIGEAEKSHLKAKAAGYDRFWTISQVRLDLGKAKVASPTTREFFSLEDICAVDSQAYQQFRDLLYQAIGIA